MKISMKLVYQYMTIFLNFSPTSNHLHPLQVENCDSNSRLVVNEDVNVKSGLKGLRVGLLMGNRMVIYMLLRYLPMICHGINFAQVYTCDDYNDRPCSQLTQMYKAGNKLNDTTNWF